MDALSDVLRLSQVNGGVYLHAEFTAPWCLSASMTTELCVPFLGPTAHLIPYHYVIEGDFHVSVDGEPPLHLRDGEIMLFPRNDTHLMGSDLRLKPKSARDLIVPAEGGGLYAIHHGGGGAKTRMVCGYLGCDGAIGNPVIAMLPAMMRFRMGDTGPAAWMRSTFQYAADEVAAGRPGSETVLAKLSELLFVEAVRCYAKDLPAEQTGWLAGLRDRPVARTLALMHGDVARNWSVEEISGEVGLSRSSLSERFTRLIGMPPMQYLAHWRMQVAAQRLKGTNTPLARIAELVGYESEASFSRAFKRSFGAAPATWRRSAGGLPGKSSR
ncbi:MAG: AraC family transcriptional regulator [Rhizomicrobium sp.]